MLRTSKYGLNHSHPSRLERITAHSYYFSTCYIMLHNSSLPSSSHLPHPLAITIASPDSMRPTFSLLMSENVWHLISSTWLISLNTNVSSSMHIATNGRFYLVVLEKKILLCMFTTPSLSAPAHFNSVSWPLSSMRISPTV